MRSLISLLIDSKLGLKIRKLQGAQDLVLAFQECPEDNLKDRTDIRVGEVVFE